MPGVGAALRPKAPVSRRPVPWTALVSRPASILAFTLAAGWLGLGPAPAAASPPPADAGYCAASAPVDRNRRLGPAPPGTRGLEGFFLVDGPVVAPAESSDGRLGFTLEAPETGLAGESLGLMHDVENRGDHAVAVVGSADGSAAGMRWPRYAVYLRDAHGRVWRWARTGGRCGNVNPLGHGDVVVLDPGERVLGPGDRWTPIAGVRVDAPGEYTLWMVYTLCPPRSLRDADLLHHYPAAFGRWASNAIVVTVTEPDGR